MASTDSDGEGKFRGAGIIVGFFVGGFVGALFFGVLSPAIDIPEALIGGLFGLIIGVGVGPIIGFTIGAIIDKVWATMNGASR